MVNQAKGEDAILWSVKFISSDQYTLSRCLTHRVVIGDSRGNLQIWNIRKRIMQDNHKAHEGDVLSISVFTYYDTSASSTTLYPTTLIVSGGVDGKVGLIPWVNRSSVSSPTWRSSIAGHIVHPIAVTPTISSAPTSPF